MIEFDFGYAFAKTMHFYGLSDEQVLKMPLRRFWLLLGNVVRISAENDLRHLTRTFVGCQANKDGVEDYRKELILEMGRPVVVEERLDKRGWNRLKQIARTMAKGAK